MTMKNLVLPLVSGKHISQFAPIEYKRHIESLYEDCPIRQAKREANLPKVIFKYTATGKPSLLVQRREPKFLTQAEFDALCAAHQLPKNVLFLYLKKRQIELRPGTECRVTEESLTAMRPPVPTPKPKPKKARKKRAKKGSKDADKT